MSLSLPVFRLLVAHMLENWHLFLHNWSFVDSATVVHLTCRNLQDLHQMWVRALHCASCDPFARHIIENQINDASLVSKTLLSFCNQSSLASKLFGQAAINAQLNDQNQFTFAGFAEQFDGFGLLIEKLQQNDVQVAIRLFHQSIQFQISFADENLAVQQYSTFFDKQLAFFHGESFCFSVSADFLRNWLQNIQSCDCDSFFICSVRIESSSIKVSVCDSFQKFESKYEQQSNPTCFNRV